MLINIGSFGSRLTWEQRVPDAVWTKVTFDKVDWDISGGFDVSAGAFVVGQRARFRLSAGLRLLAPDVRLSTSSCCYVRAASPSTY
jgi:hypothetical protein